MTGVQTCALRSEEHTSELQSHDNLVCRLLLEKTTTFSSPTSPSRPTGTSPPRPAASPRALPLPAHRAGAGRGRGSAGLRGVCLFFFDQRPPPRIPPFPPRRPRRP